MRSLIPACLLYLAGCGSGQSNTIVIADISGVVAGAQTLRATSYLNGKREQDPAEIDSSETRLAIRLPTGSLGDYRLDIDALGADQCSFAVGSGEATLSGQSQVELSITLSPLPGGIHVCGITVQTSGHGEGWVGSDPDGIRCGVQDGSCFAQFQQNSLIKLGANPRIDSSFVGWAMGCSGLALCMVTLDGPKSVLATFEIKTPSD